MLSPRAENYSEEKCLLGFEASFADLGAAWASIGNPSTTWAVVQKRTGDSGIGKLMHFFHGYLNTEPILPFWIEQCAKCFSWGCQLYNTTMEK